MFCSPQSAALKTQTKERLSANSSGKLCSEFFWQMTQCSGLVLGRRRKRSHFECPSSEGKGKFHIEY